MWQRRSIGDEKGNEESAPGDLEGWIGVVVVDLILNVNSLLTVDSPPRESGNANRDCPLGTDTPLPDTHDGGLHG